MLPELAVLPEVGQRWHFWQHLTPILGMAKSAPRQNRKSLADELFTKTQLRVLGVLFGQADRSVYASELIRMAGTGSGAAQRELARLEASGLVAASRQPRLRLPEAES